MKCGEEVIVLLMWQWNCEEEKLGMAFRGLWEI